MELYANEILEPDGLTFAQVEVLEQETELICEGEYLDKAQFKVLIDTYVYSGRQPIRGDVFLMFR